MLYILLGILGVLAGFLVLYVITVISLTVYLVGNDGIKEIVVWFFIIAIAIPFITYIFLTEWWKDRKRTSSVVTV